MSKYEKSHSIISSLPEDVEDVALLLRKHVNPLVGEMTQENLLLFSERPLLVAYYDVSWEQDLKKGEHTLPYSRVWRCGVC